MWPVALGPSQRAAVLVKDGSPQDSGDAVTEVPQRSAPPTFRGSTGYRSRFNAPDPEETYGLKHSGYSNDGRAGAGTAPATTATVRGAAPKVCALACSL
jgi:hypothetical protein